MHFIHKIGLVDLFVSGGGPSYENVDKKAACRNVVPRGDVPVAVPCVTARVKRREERRGAEAIVCHKRAYVTSM